MFGLLGSLWGGLCVTIAAQNAFDRVWAGPFKDRPNYLYARLRGLLLLVCLGVMFILAAGISGLVSALGGTLVIIGGIVLSLALNFGIYLAAFRFLTAATVPTRSLWLGAAVGAVFLEILQYLGSIYIKHFLSHASNTYGTFATVIGLLVWLHLTAQFTLYAAEVNVVLVRRLWPRSLFGPPHAPADQETFRALAKVEERHEVEQVDVRFAHEEQLPGNGHPQPELEQQPQPDR